MRTFGFSLAGGKDVDGNDYPGKIVFFHLQKLNAFFSPSADIAVGAWQSNKAIMFKTKPVVSVTGYLRPTKAAIDLNDKICGTDDFGYIAWYECDREYRLVIIGGYFQ